MDNVKIKQNLIGFKKGNSKRIKRSAMNINIFDSKNTPENDYKIPMQSSHYYNDTLDLYSSGLIDFSNRPWFSLLIKNKIK